MELFEALRRRRMVRNYTGEPIDPDALDRIAAAALGGPSAGYSQGIAVVLVDDPEKIAEIAQICGEDSYVERGFDPWLSSAGAHIVLCVEPDVYRQRYAEPDKSPTALEGVPWWWVDGGAAMMAILLAAVGEGLGAGVHGGRGMNQVADLLDIPHDVEVLCLITIGHPAPDRPSGSLDRGSRPGRAHRGRWN
ncbi:MAG TPA: nitroreductase family protein [Acidimicrobiia bacterium]|nr:nitroreductase family protein [Acidimicrobiia bacterium]